MNLGRCIAGAAIVLTASVMPNLLATAPAQARTIIGGLDLARVCTMTYGPAWRVDLVPPYNAYSWRCVNGYRMGGIDINHGCKILYRPSAYAVLLDPRNPYTWRCAV